MQLLQLTQISAGVDCHWMCAMAQKGATAYHLYVTEKPKNVTAHLLRAYKQYS